MRSRMLILLVLILTSGSSFADGGALTIDLKGPSSMLFCSDSVQFGAMVGVEGDSIFDGLNVSLANYKSGSERLKCLKSSASIAGTFNSSNGTLQLRGAATAAEYEEAIENTWYYNSEARPDTSSRQIAVSLIDADFLPSTGHYYQFKPSLDIKWTEAKAEAETKFYLGLQGYLATITSKEENDFIWTKISGVGWIGATDANEYSTEGNWVWATGPEAGTVFWRGVANGRPVNGAFSFWGNNEPNNLYGELNGGLGEDYAHVTQDPGQIPRSWNDLRDSGDGVYSDYYRPQGYVIEYGGMAGDPEVNFTASFAIKMRKVVFSSDLDHTICQNESVVLNELAHGNYSWTPMDSLSDPNRANPLANPQLTTTYLAIGNFDGCIDSATFMVQVNPSPQLTLSSFVEICAGDSVLLDASALNPTGTDSYRWNSGDTLAAIYASQQGAYQVTVTNSYNCSTAAATDLAVHSYPEIQLADESLLVCDGLAATIPAQLSSGDAQWTSDKLLFSDSKLINPEVTAPGTGSYLAHLKVDEGHGCVSRDSIELKFYNTPGTEINIDSTTCSGYSLQVDYQGSASNDAVYCWYYPDSVYQQEKGLSSLQIDLGFGQAGESKLGLQVDESGCQSELSWTPINVTPDIDISADVTEGCAALTVTFTATATEEIETYTWDFGDGLGLSTPDPTIAYTYAYAGTFDVSLTVLCVSGCSNTGVKEDFITVHPIKTVYTDIDPNYCYDHRFEVLYTGSGNENDTYNWDLSELDQEEIINNPGTNRGPLTIELRNKPEATIGLQVVSEYGCESLAKTFSFKRIPWVELDADPNRGCTPVLAELSAIPVDAVDQLSYSWDTGLRSNVDGNPIQEEYTEQGASYKVSLVATSATTGCVDSVFLPRPIEVSLNPVADFEVDNPEKIISEAIFQFYDQSTNAYGYRWDFGDGSFSFEQNPENAYDGVGNYRVHLFVENEFQCSDTISKLISVAPDQLYPPNAFNPNSTSPENRVFLLSTDAIESEGYLMRVFNRWGEEVFSSNDNTIGWDGRMKNGNFAPQGTYIWVLNYRDVTDVTREQKGTVTLVF